MMYNTGNSQASKPPNLSSLCQEKHTLTELFCPKNSGDAQCIREKKSWWASHTKS